MTKESKESENMNYNQKNGYARLLNSLILLGKENRYKKTANINKNIQNIRKMTTTQTKGGISV